jgi:hypothetical protein
MDISFTKKLIDSMSQELLENSAKIQDLKDKNSGLEFLINAFCTVSGLHAANISTHDGICCPNCNKALFKMCECESRKDS